MGLGSNTNTIKDKAQVCLGAVAAPHGVRGLVRVKPFTDQPQDIAAYGTVSFEDGRQFDLTIKGMVKGMVMTSFSGVTSRDAAEALKGERFYVPRDRLPETDDGALYHADLIGVEVEDPDRGPIGNIRGVFNFGAGEMLEVKPPKGQSLMLPFGADASLDENGVLVMAVDPVWLDTTSEPDEASVEVSS